MAMTSWTHPRSIRYLFFVLAVIFLGNCGLSAQVTASGNIAGVVTDPTGAAVVGASVTVTSTATNAERKTVTNGAGEYRFDLLPTGDYQLDVITGGFRPAQVKGLQILVGTTVTLNVPLTAGQVSQTVEVTAGNQLMDTEKTDVSTAVTQREIQALPLNGRDFANLAILAPGVKQVDSYDPTKNRYAIYAVNGSSGRNTNTTVNGIDNKDNTVGGAVMQLPLEAVQEFNISPNRFSAANGKSEGAALNVVTKSGTNQFHGSLYGFFRTQDFQTNNYFAEKGDQPKPDYSRQQYGGSFGGPIRRDKDFGFFAYEGLRERSSLSVNPDSYNELVLAANSGAFNPAPLPSHTIPTPYNDKRYNGRIDHSFSDTERAFISYTAQDNKSNNDQSTAQNDLSEGNFTINDLILTNFSLSSLLTSNLINNFTAGFQYWNNLIDSTTRTPYITFPDGTSFGTNVNVPQKSSQHKFQFRDDISWTHSSHTLRGGVDYIYEPQVGGFFENNPTPEFDFFDTPSNILGDTAKYPEGFSTPGLVQGMTGTSGDPSFNLSPKMLGLYFQDDWKVTPRLLLNLGIRYDRDIDTYGIDKQKNSRTVQELQAAAATGVPTVPATRNSNNYTVGYVPDLSYIGGTYTGLPHNDNLDFSPRIGFAFDVFGNSRVVLRGGYGLYFGQTFENIPLFMIQQSNNTVFANTFSINCSGPGDTSCSAANTVPGTNIILSNWRYGVDPFPVIPPAGYDLAPGSTGRLMNPAYRNPYTQQINFGLQIAPNEHSVVEMEYVQARGLHENKTVNINPTEYFNGGIRPFAAAFKAAGVPVLGRFGEEESIGRSYYDALNLSYRQQMWKHITGTANYTYGKALAFEGNPAAFRNTATNPFLGQFRRQDYGAAPNDETHHLTAAATVALPWKITISPIFQVGSGRPVYPDVGSSSDLWGVGSGRATLAHAILPIGAKANFAGLTALFNPDGSIYSHNTYVGCLEAGTCRELSYDATRGQTFVELDARIGKTITFAEKYNVEVFFQGFDLTNRANFGPFLQGNLNSIDPNDPSTFLKPLSFITPNSTVIPQSFTGEFGARFSF